MILPKLPSLLNFEFVRGRYVHQKFDFIDKEFQNRILEGIFVFSLPNYLNFIYDS